MRNFFVPSGVIAAALAVSVHVHAAPLAYVPLASADTVQVVDLGTSKLVASIPVGSNPMGIAFSPVNPRAYVSNTDDGTVTVIDTNANTASGNISVGPTPMGLAVSPNGRLLAVATMGTSSLSPSHTITVVGLAASRNTQVTVGSAPSAVAFNPAGSFIYVANYNDGTISVVDANTLVAVNTIPLGGDHPSGLAINPAGTLLYVLHATGLLGPGYVSVVDLTKMKVVAGIRLNASPNWLSMNPAGTRLVVAKPNGRAVSVIDTTSNTLLLDISAPACPPTSAQYSSDGKSIYVVCDSGSVLVFDAATYAQTATIGLGNSSATALGNFVQPAAYLGNTPGVLSGLFWNPAESGWGIHFTERGGNIFAAWFTFDSKGAPIWYTAPNCVLNGMTCTSTVYTVSGPIIFGQDYDPSLRNTSAVGTLTLTFTDNDNASLSYTVAGVSRTVAVTREQFSLTDGGPLVNYTDMWWNPDEPGWGAALTASADTIFIAWFVYDLSGNPTWYVAPDCQIGTDGMSCGGFAYQVSGPPFGPTFNPAAVVAKDVGLFRLNFDTPDHGTINFLSQSLFVTKTIQRMLF